MNNGKGESHIIVLADILEQKFRKEKELSYYEQQLEHLVFRMQLIKKEIELTNMIIQLVTDENIVDIRDYIDNRIDKKEH